MSQFSKNISSANKLITTALGSKKASEKLKKSIQEAPIQIKPKIQQNVFEENIKPKEEEKISMKKPNNNTNKTKENFGKNENIPSKISPNLIEESEKIDDKNKNSNKIINKNPAHPLKKQTTIEKTADIEVGLTSLEKITSPKLEKNEISNKNLAENTFSTKTKKRKKLIGNRKNIFEFHDFENFLKKIEDFGFYGDEEQKFQDEDYLISTENGEIIDSQKLLGVFNSGDFNEELVKRIEWVEISRVSEESRLTKFMNKVNKSEISVRQKIVKGKLDDNAVLNALALICNHSDIFNNLTFSEPLTLEKYLQVQINGFYGFRFFKNKTEKYSVLIDDKIPCVSLPNKKQVPIFARSSDSNEFWVSLIEKAYAKLNSNYSFLSKISLREAINDFTGLEPEIVTIKKEIINEDDLWTALELLHQNGSIIGLMSRDISINEKSKNKDNERISKYKATLLEKMFVVKEIIKTESKKRFIHVMDPWNGMPNLSEVIPSKNASKTTSSHQLIEYPNGLELFNTFVFLKDFPNEWSGVKLECPLTPSYGLPNVSNNEWTNYPQYVFEIISNNDVEMVIRLSELKIDCENINLDLGFLFFNLSPKEDKITTMNTKKLECNVRSQGESYVQKIIMIKKGRYTIIPFSSLKEGNIFLHLEIYFTCPFYQVKFVNRTEKILEKVQDEFGEANPRILKDLVKNSDLEKFTFSNKKLSLGSLLIPCNLKQAFIKDYAEFSKINLIQNSEKLQKMKKENTSAQKSQIFDPQLDNLKEAIITETLLGINDEYEEIEMQGNPNYNQNEENFDPEPGLYDFNYYQLGSKGLEGLLPTLLKENSLKILKLAGNNLNDDDIIKLCYEIEKTQHLALEQLDLSDNNIQNKGAEALAEFSLRNKDLKILLLENNGNITKKTMDQIQSVLEPRMPKKNLKKKIK